MSVPSINMKRLCSDLDEDQNETLGYKRTLYGHCETQTPTEHIINPQSLIKDLGALDAEEQRLKDAVHQLVLCTMELQSAFLRHISKIETK